MVFLPKKILPRQPFSKWPLSKIAEIPKIQRISTKFGILGILGMANPNMKSKWGYEEVVFCFGHPQNNVSTSYY